MKPPWLSVIMPTYNAAAFLSQALASVTAQADGRGVEVVAVDDGSTDETLDILESFRDRLPLTIIRAGAHTRNNWVANTNRGLERAHAAYACILHHDDVWLPGRVAWIRRSIERFPNAVMHVHPAWFIDERGGRLGLWRCPFPTDRLLSSSETVDRLLVQNSLAAGVPVFRRHAAASVGYLDPELIYPADWDFWLKLARTGPTVCLPQPLFGYRLHSRSITATSPLRLRAVADELLVILNRHIDAPSSSPRTDDFWDTCRFSLRLNVALFAVAGRQRADWLGLAKQFLRLGPTGWGRFFRDSTIVSRVLVRVRLMFQLRRQTTDHSAVPSYDSADPRAVPR